MIDMIAANGLVNEKRCGKKNTAYKAQMSRASKTADTAAGAKPSSVMVSINLGGPPHRLQR